VKTAYIDAPPPEHHGRIVENHSSINIKRMTQASAPEHVYCRVKTASVRPAATHQDVDVRSLKCSAPMFVNIRIV